MKPHNRKRTGSRKKGVRSGEKRAIEIICVILALAILSLGIYAVNWYADRARIDQDSARYRSMYSPAAQAPEAEPAASSSDGAATPTATEAPTAAPTMAVKPGAAEVASPAAHSLETDNSAPASTDAPENKAAPVASGDDAPSLADGVAATDAAPPSPTDAPMAAVTESPAPAASTSPVFSGQPAAADELIPTPNPETLVFALPSAPPVQESFSELLGHNPDTVGFLEVADIVSLPVVQRLDDNDYYLNHSFDGVEAREGALFLDGLNRLVPEDDCLIVYGHNMKNGTMFGNLHTYESLSFLKEHPTVRFDTLYENRRYVPFAAFTASMDSEDGHYFDVRQFIFDESGFELFTLKMQRRSAFDIPVDVRYGDKLLLLVTCDYTDDDGRFILCLRQLRAGETEADAARMVAGAR